MMRIFNIYVYIVSNDSLDSYGEEESLGGYCEVQLSQISDEDSLGWIITTFCFASEKSSCPRNRLVIPRRFENDIDQCGRRNIQFCEAPSPGRVILFILSSVIRHGRSYR